MGTHCIEIIPHVLVLTKTWERDSPCFGHSPCFSFPCFSNVHRYTTIIVVYRGTSHTSKIYSSGHFVPTVDVIMKLGVRFDEATNHMFAGRICFNGLRLVIRQAVVDSKPDF